MRYLLALALVLLGGCSIGIREDNSNSISETFTTPVTYQEAYRRAESFARHCHTSNHYMWQGSFNVAGDLFVDNTTGVVRVNLPNAGRDEERIEITSAGDSAATVLVRAWGIGIWDQRELAAAKQSIETGKLVCR